MPKRNNCRKSSGEGSISQVTISKFFTKKTSTSVIPSTSEGQAEDECKNVSKNEKKRPASNDLGSPENVATNGDKHRKRARHDSDTEPKTNSCSLETSKSTTHGAHVSDKTLTKLTSFSSTFDSTSGTFSESSPSISKQCHLSHNPEVKTSHSSTIANHHGQNHDSDFEMESQNHHENGSKLASKGKSALAMFASPKASTSKTSDVSSSQESTSKDTKSAATRGRNKSKYTPLEQQYMEIKEQNQDTVLFVECGYKYRFFGEDAKIAAKELNIFCHVDHNFETASIPTHRLFVHVRRLVAKGYKVGVVKQMETAALKAAGDNRSAPFTRQLTALYTKSTLIGEDVDPVNPSEDSEETTDVSTSTSNSTYLMCIYESDTPVAHGKTHNIAIVAVNPGTGDIIYDSFEDVKTRSELETRLAHVNPVELLVPETLPPATERLVQQTVALSKTADDRVRVERQSQSVFDGSQATTELQAFYSTGQSTSKSHSSDSSGSVVDVLKFPKPLLSCFAGLLHYLKEFNLHKVLKVTSNMHKFSTNRQYMQLGGCTVRNLELFSNLTNGREHGSLFWVINHTTTKFGSRLLRQWLAKPLLSVSAIEERLAAIQELLEKSSIPVITKMQQSLLKLPDLQKALTTIYHKKCSTGEFVTVCRALSSIYQELKAQHVACRFEEQLTSKLLCSLLTEILENLSDVHEWLDALNEQAAKEGDKAKLFKNIQEYPDLAARKGEIVDALQGIQDHRREVRLALRMPSLDYVTVMGTEFLIEVKNTSVKNVPRDWVQISSTKQVSRFHSPFIVSAYKKLTQLREQLQIDANAAWLIFLGTFEESYPAYQRAVHNLAILDCLFSMARLAKQDGYCRPELKEGSSEIIIEQGRHPVVDQLLGEQQQFVPNDTRLQQGNERCMVITGPNMGGKSSYIKQVALITILAQMGSYVPAESAQIGIVHAVHTRMGAADELFAGRSTFMVELDEASQIISQANEHSLVILDELGRGTSTHDGMAIAYATLKYFIEEMKCLTLFVTHYPMLTEIEQQFPGVVGNYHMSFFLKDDDEDDTEGMLTFLYQLVAGKAARSYGLNVARLATIPQDIIQTAAGKSQQLESAVLQRRARQELVHELLGLTSSERVTDMISKLKQNSDSSEKSSQQKT